VSQESLSYEQARDELIEVVRRLEAGGSTLEESLQLWERGEQLAGICQEWLDGARARLKATVSDATDSDATAGDATDSDATDSDATAGDATDSDATAGDATVRETAKPSATQEDPH
jgi:exodeoxyribonuclease VII small subunit